MVDPRGARGRDGEGGRPRRRGEVSPAEDVYASAGVVFDNATGRTPWSRDVLMARTRRAETFLLPASVLAAAPSIAEEVQQHLLRIGHPEPARRPTTLETLAESQRLRERIIAFDPIGT